MLFLLAAPGCTRPEPRPVPPDSVAVLPFTSAQGQADLIAAALPVEIAGSLALIPQLTVHYSNATSPASNEWPHSVAGKIPRGSADRRLPRH
ncbi:MAG: hypothetical protein IT167_30755 [Bryobacterales bacterium]|nr:hypothetical protein [Bryobacterales bacterium]